MPLPATCSLPPSATWCSCESFDLVRSLCSHRFGRVPRTRTTVHRRGCKVATVTFDQATRLYPGQDRPAVCALDLQVQDGEFMVLVGPSGCGKSTTLRMLAGLEPCDDGFIRIGDRDVTMLPPKDRDIAMVFQNYALYPHMTVAENIGFHLRISKVPKDEIDKRVGETAALLDLVDYLGRKPAKLS